MSLVSAILERAQQSPDRTALEVCSERSGIVDRVSYSKGGACGAAASDFDEDDDDDAAAADDDEQEFGELGDTQSQEEDSLSLIAAADDDGGRGGGDSRRSGTRQHSAAARAAMLGHLQFMLLHAILLSHLCDAHSLHTVLDQMRRATPLVPFGRHDVALLPIALPGLVLCLGLSDARAGRAALRRRALMGAAAFVAAYQLPRLSLLLYGHVGTSPGMGQLLQRDSMLRGRTTLWFLVMVPLLRALHLCCTACGVGRRGVLALATAVHFASGHRAWLAWPFARGPCQSCLPDVHVWTGTTSSLIADVWTRLMAQTLHLNCPHLSSLWPAYAAAPLLLPPGFPARSRHGTALLYHGWAVASVLANYAAAQAAVFGFRRHVRSSDQLPTDSHSYSYHHLERPVQVLFACASLLVVGDAVRTRRFGDAPFWRSSFSLDSSSSSSTTTTTTSATTAAACSAPSTCASPKWRVVDDRIAALYRYSLILVSLFWGLCRCDAKFQPANVLYDSVRFGGHLAASPHHHHLPPSDLTPGQLAASPNHPPPDPDRSPDWTDPWTGTDTSPWHHRVMLVDGCASLLAFSCVVAWAEAMPRRATPLSRAGASTLLPYVLHPHALPAVGHAFLCLLRKSADACPLVLPWAVAVSLCVLLQLAMAPALGLRRPTADGRSGWRPVLPSRTPVLAGLVWALLVWWHGWQPPPRAPSRAHVASIPTPFTCTTDLASTAPCLPTRARNGRHGGGRCLSSNASLAACAAECNGRLKCGGFAVAPSASCTLLGPTSFATPKETLRPAPCIAFNPGVAMPCAREGLLCAKRRLAPPNWRSWKRAFNLTLETAWQRQVPPSLCRFVIQGETLDC